MCTPLARPNLRLVRALETPNANSTHDMLNALDTANVHDMSKTPDTPKALDTLSTLVELG
jgi:hypothetical protein